MFANTIALGVLTRCCKNIVDKEYVIEALKEHFRNRFEEENERAFALGYESVANIPFSL